MIRDVHGGPFLPLVEGVPLDALVALGQVSEHTLRRRAYHQPDRLAEVARLELARRETL